MYRSSSDILLSLVFVVSCLFHGQAQQALQPGAVTYFDLQDGLVSDCIDWMGQDPQGRFWYTACSPQQSELGLKLFWHDGSRSRVIRFDSIGELGSDQMLSPFEIDNDGILSGYIGSEKVLFWYNTYTGTVRFRSYKKEVRGNSNAAAKVGGTYAMISHLEDSTYVYFMDSTKILKEFSFASFAVSSTQALRIAEDDKQFWLWTSTGELYRVDDQLQLHYYDALISRESLATKHLPSIEAESLPDGRTVFALHDQQGIQIQAFDPINEEIKPLEGVDPFGRGRRGNSQLLFSDNRGNVVLSYENPAGESFAQLRTVSGIRDYRQVLKGLDRDRAFVNLYSQNFERLVQRFGRALVHGDVLPPSSVASIPLDGGARKMIQIGNQLYVRGGVYDLDTYELIELLDPEKFNLGSPDVRYHNDYLWGSGSQVHLHRYDPRTKQLRKYLLDQDIRRFLFLNDSTILFSGLAEPQDAPQGTRTYLRTYNLSTGNISPLISNGSDVFLRGNPNVMYRSADRSIYVGTTAGLYRVSQEMDSTEQVSIFDGEQVMDIIESSTGAFWVATYQSGLWRWNQTTDEVNVIDTERGLSNNSAVSVLEDDRGNIWANTYYGVNLVSPNLEVQSKLFEVHGIKSNEGNRWSSLKLNDGRIAFGAFEGVSIIDPEHFINNITKTAPSIYLTGIVYRDVKSGSEITLDQPMESLGPVALGASDRSIEISFALSQLIEKDLCNYAYKVRGKRDSTDWAYLGSSRTLYLRNLPAGRYDIVIKGADHQGNWTNVPVVVPIVAEQYFYKKNWFYALVAGLLLGLLILWLIDQRRRRHVLEEEVQKRTRTISEQTEKLQQLDQAKNRLYTNITHEFRTPLTVISGAADHIQGSDQEVDMIKRNSAQLLGLVNQMLDLRKLESGEMQLMPVQSDIIGFARYLSESFRSLAEAKNVQFHFLTDEEAFSMDFDVNALTRIITNLLSNAIKFTGSGGNIYLDMASATSDSTEYLTIKVRDTGIGIPAHAVEHIFDRFYQVDNQSARAGEGTGIGLTLVREIVEVMGGQITVNSKEGSGTTFNITLPVTREAEVVESIEISGLSSEAIIPAQTVSVITENQKDKPVALLVEDNADVLQYLIKTLADDYNLVLAMDGAEGIEKAIETIPDIIVSDVMMPVTDGLDLCKQLKLDDKTSHIPIILLTARAELETRLEGIERGADSYLSKPFNSEELSTVMRSLLRNRDVLRKRYASLTSIPHESSETSEFEDAFVQRFIAAVEKNMEDEDYGVPRLCRDLGISRAQLHRKITAITGHPTAQYMKLIKLRRAKELLTAGQLNISQVAYATGFRDPSYFGKVFQQEFGMTPGQYKSGDA